MNHEASLDLDRDVVSLSLSGLVRAEELFTPRGVTRSPLAETHGVFEPGEDSPRATGDLDYCKALAERAYIHARRRAERDDVVIHDCNGGPCHC